MFILGAKSEKRIRINHGNHCVCVKWTRSEKKLIGKGDGINEEGRLNERNTEDEWRRRSNEERKERDKERKRMGVNERETKVQLVERGKG